MLLTIGLIAMMSATVPMPTADGLASAQASLNAQLGAPMTQRETAAAPNTAAPAIETPAVAADKSAPATVATAPAPVAAAKPVAPAAPIKTVAPAKTVARPAAPHPAPASQVSQLAQKASAWPSLPMSNDRRGFSALN